MLQTPRLLRQQTNGTYQSQEVWHAFSEKAIFWAKAGKKSFDKICSIEPQN
jgi:hypothetical protein